MCCVVFHMVEGYRIFGWSQKSLLGGVLLFIESHSKVSVLFYFHLLWVFLGGGTRKIPAQFHHLEMSLYSIIYFHNFSMNIIQ